MNTKNISDLLKLTPAQEDLLRESTVSGSSGRVAQALYRITGPLDAERFRSSCRALVERHFPLRSSIHWEGMEQPVQAVRKSMETDVECFVLGDGDEPEQERKMLELCAAQRAQGFDEKRPPLHRISLATVNDREHFVVFTYDGLILDAHSARYLLEEVFSHYGNPDSSYQDKIAAAIVEFKDYVNQLHHQESGPAVSFWRTLLASIPGATSLDAGSSSPDDMASEYRLAKSTVLSLRKFAQSCACDLETLLMGAWALFLCRRASMDDVVFGVTCPVSAEARAQSPIGCVSRVLPLRIKLEPEIGLRDWLSSLQSIREEMERFSGMGLKAISEAAGLPENTQLFSTSISFVEAPAPVSIKTANTKTRNATIVAEDVATWNSQPGVTSLVVEIEAEIVLRLHGPRSGDARSADRLLRQFAALLESCVTHGNGLLFAISAFSDVDHALLAQVERGDSATARLVHEHFSEIAQQHPGATAVRFEDQELTYAQLDARSNQLAHYLQSLGAGPEQAVGVFMPRCLETAVALLGILKAGGVYLPLDPEYPAERISFLIEDAAPSVLITKDEFLAQLPLSAAASQLVSLDSDSAQVEMQPESAPQLPVFPANLAYVIYTSGSTGMPKGVGVSHGAAAEHLDAMALAFGYTAADRAMLFASLSFDVSIEQLLAPLLAGASVVIRGAEALSSREFRQFLKSNSVTVANTPPAFWRELTEEGFDDASAFSNLRLVVLGGDVLRPEAAQRWLDNCPRYVPLINAYGPTEAVITACIHRLPDVVNTAAKSVPIGYPLAGRTAFILDHWSGPVPVETWGELYLGGEMLARGYMGQPALTAERFVPDSFSRRPGARLYRTGDLARYLPDGSIEFRGRADHQVKIRGFRIELGEIEAALEAHPAVLQAAVVARETGHGEKRLAAYMVLSDAATEIEAVRDYLREKLPDYMLPAFLHVLDALPMTVSGKIDRNALASLAEEESAGTTKGVDLASETEKQLGGIWAEVLGITEIGAESDFFESGGDSMVATSLITRMEKRFAIEIPLRVLFDGPTIRQVAAYIDATRDLVQPSGQVSNRPLLARVSRDRDLPVTFAQERLWVLSQLRSQASFYNISGGIRLAGELDVCALDLALAELVRRHEPLRTVFQLKDESVVQLIQAPYAIPLEPVDLSMLDPLAAQVRLETLAHEEAERPYDLAVGPVLRVRLFRITDQEHVLWLTIHHIVGDGQSIAILLNEMCVLYEAFAQGLSSPLPEPELQFADYACWQREWLTESELAAQLDYWRVQLANAPTPMLLPQERDAIQATYTGNTLAITVARETPGNLRELAARKSATSFMVLLAAWKMLLHAYSQTGDVVVGTHIANRSHPEVESLVGFFINVLVLKTNLSGNPTFAELLDRVRDVSLQAFQHQDMPFDRLVDELRPRTGMGQTPFFKTFFAMQNSGIRLPEISGIKTTLIAPEDQSAKFDLTLFASESPAEESEDAINIAFNYKTHRFTVEGIQRIAQDYRKLLIQAVANPELRLDELVASAIASPSGRGNGATRKKVSLRNPAEVMPR